MSGRLWRRWRGPRAVAAELLQDAGEHVAQVVTAATKSAGRAVALGVLAGIVVGAALVWLGVSIGRPVT